MSMHWSMTPKGKSFMVTSNRLPMTRIRRAQPHCPA